MLCISSQRYAYQMTKKAKETNIELLGFRVSFFMVHRQHQCLYSMVEVGSMVFSNPLLDTLDALASKKHLNTLARVSASFWKTVQPNPTHKRHHHLVSTSLHYIR